MMLTDVRVSTAFSRGAQSVLPITSAEPARRRVPSALPTVPRVAQVLPRASAMQATPPTA